MGSSHLLDQSVWTLDAINMSKISEQVEPKDSRRSAIGFVTLDLLYIQRDGFSTPS